MVDYVINNMETKEIAFWPFPEDNCLGAHKDARNGVSVHGTNGRISYLDGYQGPAFAICSTDLNGQKNDEIFADLSPYDTISLVGHCAPGLSFISSPDKKYNTFPIHIVTFLANNGYEFRSQIVIRACNSASNAKQEDMIYRLARFRFQDVLSFG